LSKGEKDIHRGVIRTIGDPHERFFEDRLRMLRAFRFAARFGFVIDSETEEAIRENANRFFPSVAMERVWQEFNKMVVYPRFDQAIVEMHRLSLLDVIFPEIAGMHIKEMREKVKHFTLFPPQCPTILYLMEILTSLPFAQKMDITKRIKSSNKDLKLLEFIEMLDQAVIQEEQNQGVDDHRWATLFAHPDWEMGMRVLAARYACEEHDLFFQHYLNRFTHLEPHIQRIKKGKPLVTANLLQQHGIPTGKKDGIAIKGS